MGFFAFNAATNKHVSSSYSLSPYIGSEEERAAMRRASSHSKRNQRALAKLYKHVEKDVEFKLTVDAKKTGDIDYTLSASNTSGVARTITIKMHTVAKYYTGQLGDDIGSHKESLVLEPKQSTFVNKILDVSEI